VEESLREARIQQTQSIGVPVHIAPGFHFFHLEPRGDPPGIVDTVTGPGEAIYFVRWLPGHVHSVFSS